MAEPDLTMARLLAAVENAPPVGSVQVLAQILGEQVDAREVSFLIADISGDTLWRLSAMSSADRNQGKKPDSIPLPDTHYDEVIRSQRLSVTEAEDSDGYLVSTPVTIRGDAIGILEVITAEQPTQHQRQQIARAAHALAYVVTANRRFTDLYEWGRRTATPTLSAEIQQNLLPASLACEAGQATIAGSLEPAGQIAGDTYDYSVEENTLHISLTDAMGHNVPAALLATLIVNSLRQTRRARYSLAQQAREAHRAVLEHGREATVTGQLVRIDLTSGRAQMVNAGHPWPLRLREGRVDEIEPVVDLPFGGPWHEDYHVQELDLKPGDRLILFSDGMTERNTSALDLPELIRGSADSHPREAVRVMTRALREATSGHLIDDATVLILDWNGPGSSERTSVTGANAVKTVNLDARDTDR